MTRLSCSIRPSALLQSVQVEAPAELVKVHSERSLGFSNNAHSLKCPGSAYRWDDVLSNQSRRRDLNGANLRKAKLVSNPVKSQFAGGTYRSAPSPLSGAAACHGQQLAGGPIRRHPKSSRCVGPPRFHHGASAAMRHQMGPSGPIRRTPSTRVKSIMIARPFLSGSALRSTSGAAAKTRSRSFSSVAIRAHP